MKLKEHIANILGFRKTQYIEDPLQSGCICLGISNHPFGRVIFRNAYSLLTSLINDVTFTLTDKTQVELFVKFKRFINTYGESILNSLFEQGYVVIADDMVRFRILCPSAYRVTIEDGRWSITANDETPIYVFTSDIFDEKLISYSQHLHPYIAFLDNVLNASSTLSERLGTLVVASPKNLSAAPTETILTKEVKDKLEKEIATQYGSLRHQKQIMILPREMAWQTIDLSGFDNHTTDKVRMCVEVIADALHISCNQLAIIDAQSSKALANGGEIREGDILKYKTFERLLDRTFVKWAEDMSLKVDYTIYNKPTTTL